MSANAGIDVKYGLTRGLTADVTVNTDFAQVEEDEQQINLTRFNLFFPEKRDFFLEGQGIFDFGGVSGQRASGVLPIMFFSRRIGLNAGQSVPVLAGGRVTGKAGRFDVGALAITTDEKPSADAVTTTFSALRLRRNILRRSSVGAIATGRWPAASGAGDHATAGIDADCVSSRTCRQICTGRARAVTAGCAGTMRAIAADSVTPATATDWKSTASSSNRTSIRKLDSSGELISR